MSDTAEITAVDRGVQPLPAQPRPARTVPITRWENEGGSTVALTGDAR